MRLQSYLVTMPAFPWSRPMIKPWLFIGGSPNIYMKERSAWGSCLETEAIYHITLRENTRNCTRRPDGFSGCHSLTCILRWQMLVSVYLASNTHKQMLVSMHLASNTHKQMLVSMHLASNRHKLDFALETGVSIKNKVCRPSSSFSPRDWKSGR